MGSNLHMDHQKNSKQKMSHLYRIIPLFVILVLCVSTAGLPLSQAQTVSVGQLYQNVQNSVVVITGWQSQTSIFGTSYSLVQGSGFVYNLNGRMVIITNYHVVYNGVNFSVTFRNGNGYAATLLGADPYADLAVVSINAPASEFSPLQIVSSSNLSVGDFVAAIGSPFGLSGSITTGIVSQLGRTITETTTGSYPIANIIQTDAPINPGNSGGPLLNGNGQVVGINTATVSGSTGVGFAIPSDTILREINDIVSTGTYSQHAYLGISSTDMTYDIANRIGSNLTYGVLLQQVVSGGPADQAGLKAGSTQTTVGGSTITFGGDIIIALNGTKIINSDQLSSYLEQKTLPGQTITATILRNGQKIDMPVILGTRPPPAGFTPPSAVPSTTPTVSPSISNASPSVSPAIAEISPVAVAVTAVAVTLLGALLAKRGHLSCKYNSRTDGSILAKIVDREPKAPQSRGESYV